MFVHIMNVYIFAVLAFGHSVIMSIEEDIKQSHFRTDYQRAIVNLAYTHSWLLSEQTRLLKPYGLTMAQYNVLRILRGQHPQPATVNTIIERMMDKMSNASRIVDKLLAKGLVLRQPCCQDRRAVDVLITDEGLALLAQLDTQQAVWEKLTNRLTEREACRLSRLLDKLRSG